ncbi:MULTISPECIES: hypothetical protein [unclassified Arcicella]|uniref:hypothetical protein n=1 Tax=unclassified Arcicella TaxID=2644986 RepID=UPI002862E661|nr:MULTISPECIES: hypothetical protein [unclassified Arcicella]MDR6564037.1 hypothetical protein [Arcicella sp. BE51]MDR6813790.1 hypothetical protein [Arcicella sp. BE140]MDR6825102.1 hypothetical protein [Arcicella sp. BE139]
MLKGILKYSVLILAIFLWLQAYFPAIYMSTKLFPDDYRFGDLYRLSYLPEFKQKAENCHENSKPLNSDTSYVHLYIIGDSFSEEARVNKTDFNAGKYTYIHWAKDAYIQLDSTKRNILILESVERSAKEHLSKDVDNFRCEKPVGKVEEPHLSFRQKVIRGWDKVSPVIFPPGTEERLEHTLFNYDIFLWFRELKAKMTLVFFDRIEPKVILSQDKQHLFYMEEADSTHGRSAFFPVTDAQIDTFVTHANNSKEKYLKAGFDEVYLSIIPNKVSVQSPDLGKYNHLIERIQSNPALSVPVIDTYGIFRKSPEKYYLKSDTHWNCTGRNVWLGIINKQIIGEGKK